ncbi:MAG: hypothetical protein ABI806_04345 [Candidatus Solibacter sp.]
MVLWLTGVDYFSTLGYQPGIALLAAGVVSPIATVMLVVVTLACALPIYAQVARRSYVGQGSLALLENLLPGWRGRVFVLILLGFAGTDFVITMTLSAADAAQHAIENPLLHSIIGGSRIEFTIGLLVLLALVFLAGFKEAIRLAGAVAIPYLLLNLAVLIRSFWEIAQRPELFQHWQASLAVRGDWTTLVIAGGLIFPKLALGLSGFETGVSVMPLVAGDAEDRPSDLPLGRIRNTRKLLTTAALIMSFMLVLSSFVTTLLIPPEAYRIGGPASGRAIAYLAHSLLGAGFGTVYDLSSILILWFAGASAMAGLLHLIPRYLPRFGMAPLWVAYTRPLVLVLLAISVLVTLAFRADVEAQGGAYATGVLVLMLSAAVAAALALWREHDRFQSAYCWMVSVVFLYTLVDNVIERPDGIIIASIFITAVIVFSAASRYRRATELRVRDLTLVDETSSRLWQSIVYKKVNLVPIRSTDPTDRERKVTEIRRYYTVDGPLAFVHVQLLDNRSEFLANLKVRVTTEGDHYLIQVSQAIAIANTIAYISELTDPISIFLGLSRQNLMTQALRYLLWGEGETGLMVYTILVRYWNWTPPGDVRPVIFLISE